MPAGIARVITLVPMAALALAIAACSAAPTPGPTATETVAPATPTPQAEVPSPEDILRELSPPGATELSRAEVGGALYTTFTSPASIEDLALFWDERLAILGIPFETASMPGGGISYVLSVPIGRIVAVPESGEGPVSIAISVVTGP